jgi:hypothetical protein
VSAHAHPTAAEPRAVAQVKNAARERETELKASAMTSPAVFRGVDKAKLTAILKNAEKERADKTLVRPSIDDLPATVPTLKTEPLKASLRRGIHLEVTEENAALCAQAKAADPWGREELWAIEHSKSGKPEYLWATPSAIASKYPDAFTRERRRQAGVFENAKAGRPQLIERFGVFRRPLHG